MSKFEWQMGLLDKTSGPASTIAKKLELVDARMRSINRAEAQARTGAAKDRLMFARMGLEIQRNGLLTRRATMDAKDNASTWDHTLGLVGKVGGAIVGIGSAIGHTVVAGGRLLSQFGMLAVEAASYKESTLFAMETLLGSKPAAEAMVNDMVKMAAASPFETKDIMKWSKGLLVGGFSREEVPTMLRALGDLAAMNDFDTTMVDRVALALKQIRSKGKLMGNEMLQLGEAGVPIQKVYDILGKMYGKKDRLSVQKLQESGGIGAQEAIYATLQALRDNISGGKLGGAQKRFSTTVTGLLSTIKSRPFELLMNLDKSSGYGKLRGFLQNIADLFDPFKPSGQRIMEKASKLFGALMDGMFGGLEGPEGLAKLEKVMDRVGNLIEGGAAGLRGFIEGFKNGLQPVFGDLNKLFEGPMTPDKIAQIEAAFLKWGERTGILVGQLVKLAEIFSKVLGVIDSIEGASYRLGRWMNKGSEVKVRNPSSGLRLMDQESVDMLAEQYTRERLATPEARGSARPQVLAPNVTVQVSAPGATEAAASSVAKATSESVRDCIGAMCSSVAMSRGAY